MLKLPAKRRANQVQTALALDYGHPLVKAFDPIAVYSPLHGGMFDFVAQKYVSPLNGAAIVPGHRGMAGYSVTNAVDSAVGQMWDTGLFPTANWRSCFGLFTVLDINNISNGGYYCGTHDGTNRFYLGQCFASTADVLCGWGDLILTAPRRSTLAPGLIETMAFSVTNANEMRLFENGILGSNYPANMTAPMTRSFRIGKRASNNSDALVSDGTSTLTHLVIIGRGAASDAAHFALAKNPWQIFKPTPVRWTGNSLVSLPTLGRPASDTSTGQWTPSSGATLSGVLDEALADDGDFISVAAFSTCEVLLSETNYPGSAEQTVSYRASSTTGNGLTVTLKQNGSPIASWSHALTSTVTLYTQTLTAPQIALIGAGALYVTLTST